MADYSTLKSAIRAVIKQNGNNEITGNILQSSLLAMINSLGAGYQYISVATPSTNPGTPDEKVCYLATTAGTYANFNGLVVNDGEVCILKYDTAWHKEVTGAATKNQLDLLGQNEFVIERTTPGTYPFSLKSGDKVLVINDCDVTINIRMFAGPGGTGGAVADPYIAAGEYVIVEATQDIESIRMTNEADGHTHRVIISKMYVPILNFEDILEINKDLGRRVETFDISRYRASGGVLAEYNDLASALNAIPVQYRLPGMSIRFIMGGKYVQYFLNSKVYDTTPSTWITIEDYPKFGSENSVKSGGIYDGLISDAREINASFNRATATSSCDVPLVAYKNDLLSIELNTEDVRTFNLTYRIGYQDGTIEVMGDESSVPNLSGRIMIFSAKKDIAFVRVRWENVSAIDAENPFVFDVKITAKRNYESGILAKIKTTKEVVIPVANYVAENEIAYAIYKNVSGQYGGQQAFKANLVPGTGFRYFDGRVGYNCVTLLPRRLNNTIQRRIFFTNPNSIEYEMLFVTREYFNKTFPQTPFNYSSLGCGRNIISPVTSQYCHNSHIAMSDGFTYCTYHSSSNHRSESTGLYRNNVYLTAIEDGVKIIGTRPIFSDQEFIEEYDGVPILRPYNDSLVDRGDDILIRCGFVRNDIHWWMYKTFNKTTWELSAPLPQKLSFGGNVYDWNHINYVAMLNSLYGKSYSTTGQLVTQQIINMAKYNDKYYLVACSKITQEDNIDTTPVPFVFMESTDAITWTPIAMICDTELSSEQAIAIRESKVFMIYRPGHQSLKYMVFDLFGNIIKQPTELTDTIDSKPAAFVYDNKVYAIFNKQSILPVDVHYGRTRISISYLNGDNELDEVKEYSQASGLCYFDVAIRNNQIRFTNIEDNGGILTGSGPVVQCSICEINPQDLRIA